MSDLTIRCIEDNRAERLTELWRAAFPSDPVDYIDGFFAHLSQDTVTMVGEIDEKAVTMLFLLPAEARFRGKSYPVRYLYAGCTHPQYRGRGYYRELMSAAAQTVAAMGENAIYLHPADEKLTATYQRLGYRAGIFGGDHFRAENKPSVYQTVNEYMMRRSKIIERLSENTVIWSANEDVTRFFVADAVARGATMLGDNERAALVLKDNAIESLSADGSRRDNMYCLWLPIGDTPISALMEKFEAFTGLVGD